MSEEQTGTGKCLCGSVTIKAKSVENGFHACHCGMCRRWTGSTLMASACADVAIEGEENITVFESSDWAERGFCKNCGSHLFYRGKGGGFYMLPIGLIQEGDKLPFKEEYFIEHKPANYTFANKTDQLTGQQVFEKFAPK